MLAGSKFTPTFGRFNSFKNAASAGAVSWPVSRPSAIFLAAKMSATVRSRSTILANAGSDLFVRQKTGVESHERQAELCGNFRAGPDGFQILLPRRVRRDAAGRADGFQRGIILANAAEHAGDNLNFVFPENLSVAAPDLPAIRAAGRARAGRGRMPVRAQFFDQGRADWRPATTNCKPQGAGRRRLAVDEFPRNFVPALARSLASRRCWQKNSTANSAKSIRLTSGPVGFNFAP